MAGAVPGLVGRAPVMFTVVPVPCSTAMNTDTHICHRWVMFGSDFEPYIISLHQDKRGLLFIHDTLD